MLMNRAHRDPSAGPERESLTKDARRQDAGEPFRGSQRV
jgi:hypothetical protein